MISAGASSFRISAGSSGSSTRKRSSSSVLSSNSSRNRPCDSSGALSISSGVPFCPGCSTCWGVSPSSKVMSSVTSLSVISSGISSTPASTGFSSGPSKSEKPFLSRGSRSMVSKASSSDAGSRSNRISSSADSRVSSVFSLESSVSNTISSVEGPGGSGESGWASSVDKSSSAINKSCVSISSGAVWADGMRTSSAGVPRFTAPSTPMREARKKGGFGLLGERFSRVCSSVLSFPHLGHARLKSKLV